MKLYYSPGACSLSPHIALREAKLPFELVKVERSKKLPDGSSFLDKNPKGYVPCLELDGGELLTEGPAIVQFVADKVPEAKLAPANGPFERVRLQEWLNYIGTEVHKSFTPLFAPNTPDDFKPVARENVKKRLAFVDAALAKGPYLLGETFSVADIYLFVVAGWAKFVEVDISGFANLGAFLGRVAERPAVVESLKAEGLLKA